MTKWDKRYAAVIIGIGVLAIPCFAESATGNADTSTETTERQQTQQLRERLESFWSAKPQSIVLSFTGLNTSFAVHHIPKSLRLKDCSYDVDGDVTGLIAILAAANIRVGYPAGWESDNPEARFGVYLDVDSPHGVDLWFDNPMHLPLSHELVVIGESHDGGKNVVYKITAAATLRNELWAWAHAHGHPRKETIAGCKDVE